ncbi:MAG: arginine--tRNA ligase [Candidatus Thermoplasmatota archaeon]|jgi:arginyl-tRNA synthetase|nr:arginine--tRNA ligase [Candidatus Thermoplasmatota archaeon]
MKPYQKFDAMAKEKVESFLSANSVENNYRTYRAQKNFGDISFDFQKSRVIPDADKIAALSDQFVTFSPKGKFVNVRFNDQEFSKTILEDGMNGSLFQFEGRKEKVLIEHTSANPTGPLHIGRVRNSIIGDTLSRILSKYGYDVTTEYYVNDIGTQVEALLLGTELFGMEDYTESYRRVYENFDSYKAKVEEYMVRAESGDSKFLKESKEKLEIFLRDVLSDLEKLSIKFDFFIWESEFILNGSVKELILKLTPLLKDENGAKYLESSQGNMYLLRSNGTTVYFTRDISHHLLKSSRYDNSIVVLGEDHKSYFKKIEFAMDILGVHNVSALFYSYISTKEGKMSTRRGNVVYVREFIEEAINGAKEEILKRRNDLSEEEVEDISKRIGVAAVRYNIIKYAPDKPVTFDLSEALNFDGDAAPFVMYSYARAKSILSRSGTDSDMIWKFTEPESAILREIALFPEVVEEAVKHSRPDKIARYSYELSGAFNQFYRDCPVIGSGENLQRRVEIVKTFAKTMEELFQMLGIQASDKI